MYKHDIELRVRYAETDQMGYVYHGVYATYYEVARVETLRQLGVAYKELEEKGTLLPVVDLQIKYLRPATYDEQLRIETTIVEPPGVTLKFMYNCFNAQGEKINEASTTLAFIDKKTQRPTRPSKELRDLLAPYF